MHTFQFIQEAVSIVEPTTLIQLAVGITVLIGHAIGVYKFVQNGRDADRKEYIEHRRGIEKLMQQSNSFNQSEVKRLDNRINDVKDIYVRKPDMEKEFTRIYELLDRDRESMNAWMEKLDQRIIDNQNNTNTLITKHLTQMVEAITNRT